MTVKIFRSTDYGAPANTYTAGSAIAILDACLVNGYGSQTPTSVTQTGGVATVTLPTAHTLQNNTYIRISGATQTDYNGDFPITVTGATTFTYPISNSPASPATGTITSKVAPAAWTKPFSGTNLASYKTGAGSNGRYLRVDDTTTSASRVKAYETMTDVNTGTGIFPTDTQQTGGLYLQKSASATSYAWDIIADEKAAHMFFHNGTNRQYHFFGDFPSMKSGDLFNTLINFPPASTASSTDTITHNSSTAATTSGHYIARPHTQTGSSLAVGAMLDRNSGQTTSGVSSGALPYPCPIDGNLHLSNLLLTDPSVGFRGTIPGYWAPLHSTPFQQNDIITGTGVNSERRFIAEFSGGTVNQMLIEISNTWYS